MVEEDKVSEEEVDEEFERELVMFNQRLANSRREMLQVRRPKPVEVEPALPKEPKEYNEDGTVKKKRQSKKQK